jgi:hypothetical protein
MSHCRLSLSFSLTICECRGDSQGEGVEREVLTAAFAKFIQSEAQWLIPHANGFCTIASASNLSSRAIPDSRRRGLQALGALAALLIIHGFPPEPLDPLVIYYILNDSNLHSLTQDVLREWHPELHQTISEWINIGPDGDLMPFQGHFMTYHEIQVRLLLLPLDLCEFNVFFLLARCPEGPK